MIRIAFVMFALFATASAETMKLSDMAEGSEFTKCIKIDDFHTKRAADDVEVVAKDATSGCCPEGYIPGVKHYNSYDGAQILCGFKDDGTIKVTSSSSNGVKSCEYNKCYVNGLGHKCADDTFMKINGCCGADNKKTNYKDDCMMYSKSFTSITAAKSGTKVEYCLSYHKKYKMEGTADKTDDQKDGKLDKTKLYLYTPCSGNGGGDGGSGSGAAATTAATTAPSTASKAMQAAFGFGGVAVLASFSIFS